MKISDYFRDRDRGWVLSLLALACLIYLPFLGSPFFFDDVRLLDGTGLRPYSGVFRLDLRWFPYASLSWTAAIFSNVAPHFFRLGNLLLHIANSIFLFYLLRQIIVAVQPEVRDSSKLVWGAWLGALIFVLHPVAVYAVGYVVQRSIVMATLFVLLMQMTYLRGLLTGQIRWLALSVLCYFVAIFSKEHSVLSPAVLLMLTFLLRGKIAGSRKALWVTWAAFFGLAVLVTLRAKGVLGNPYEPMAAALFEQQGVEASTPLLHFLSAMTQAGLFFKYLLLWALPNVGWMSVDMREPFVSTWADWHGWLGLLAFLIYGAASVRLLLSGGTRGLIGFALLYPWVQFLVECSGIRVQEPFVLYRSYLWMPGLMLLAPLLMLHFSRRQMVVTLSCLALVLVPLAWNRLWVLSDNFRLWNDAALTLKSERAPGADRIYYNRGQALMQAHEWEKAAADFERSMAISPQLAPIHHMLGQAYFEAGRNEQALMQFDAAIGIDPQDDRYHFSKGLVLGRLQRRTEEREEMATACRLRASVACMWAAFPKNR